MTPPRYPSRMVVCPECQAERETKAAPRTRLRCRGCGASYLSPSVERTAPADVEPAAPAPTGGHGGVKIVKVGEVLLRPVVPPSAELPEPTPPAAPAPDPEPTPPAAPAPPVAERVRSRIRRPMRRGR